MYIAITLFATKMQIKCRITKYPLLKRRSFIPIPLYHTQYICPFVLLFKEIATICRRILIFSNTPLFPKIPQKLSPLYIYSTSTPNSVYLYPPFCINIHHAPSKNRTRHPFPSPTEYISRSNRKAFVRVPRPLETNACHILLFFRSFFIF